MKRINAFTIDIEDGISIAMRDYFHIEIEPTDRVITNTERLLGLLEKYQVRATFFVVGKVARQFPELIKRIAKNGHEIGAHGYSHKQYYRLTPEEVRQEIFTTKSIIENIIGDSVLGHRAPAFSITPSSSWIFSVLSEAGFLYDSSIMPVKTSRYGWPDFNKNIVNLNLPNKKELLEIPLSVYGFPGKSFPACGGGYLKLFPFWMTNYFIQSIQKKRMAMIYIHPHDIDTMRYPDFFRQALLDSSLKTQFKIKTLKINKHTVLPKIDRLLKLYEFTNLKEIISKLDLHSLDKFEISCSPTQAL